MKNENKRHAHAVDDLLATGPTWSCTPWAWNLKAWFGRLRPMVDEERKLIKMKSAFLHAIVLLPAHILRNGRRVIYAS